MKLIVIGPSLSGKTTIIRELRKDTTVSISEMDEMLTKENNGEFPADINYKNSVLAPKIISDILNKEETIFFTNTDYFSLKDLEKAKTRGFKIAILDIIKEELIKRNKYRVANEGYQDQSKWLDGMLQYLQQLKNSGLVDVVLDATQPSSQIATKIQQLSNHFIPQSIPEKT